MQKIIDYKNLNILFSPLLQALPVICKVRRIFNLYDAERCFDTLGQLLCASTSKLHLKVWFYSENDCLNVAIVRFQVYLIDFFFF